MMSINRCVCVCVCPYMRKKKNEANNKKKQMSRIYKRCMHLATFSFFLITIATYVYQSLIIVHYIERKSFWTSCCDKKKGKERMTMGV